MKKKILISAISGLIISVLTVFIKTSRNAAFDYNYGFPIKYMYTLSDVAARQFSWGLFAINSLILAIVIFLLILVIERFFIKK